MWVVDKDFPDKKNWVHTELLGVTSIELEKTDNNYTELRQRTKLRHFIHADNVTSKAEQMSEIKKYNKQIGAFRRFHVGVLLGLLPVWCFRSSVSNQGKKNMA